MHVVSAYKGRAMVEMTVDEAKALLAVDNLDDARPALVIEAAERDVERIRRRDPDLADSVLSASMIAMAYEVANPYNSSTSKSMCQARIEATMDTLRALMPPERKRDSIDELADKRTNRLAARVATAEVLPRT